MESQSAAGVHRGRRVGAGPKPVRSHRAPPARRRLETGPSCSVSLGRPAPDGAQSGKHSSSEAAVLMQGSGSLSRKMSHRDAHTRPRTCAHVYTLTHEHAQTHTAPHTNATTGLALHKDHLHPQTDAPGPDALRDVGAKSPPQRRSRAKGILGVPRAASPHDTHPRHASDMAFPWGQWFRDASRCDPFTGRPSGLPGYCVR